MENRIQYNLLVAYCVLTCKEKCPRTTQKWWIWLSTWRFFPVCWLSINTSVCLAFRWRCQTWNSCLSAQKLICRWTCYGELKWSAQLHIAAWQSEAGVIQKPDGLESASARSKSSFSQQMFVCSMSSEAFCPLMWIDTTFSTPVSQTTEYEYMNE